MNPTQTAAWKDLQAHFAETRSTRLEALFKNDPARAAAFTFGLNGFSLDLSRTHITAETVSLLTKLAEEQGFSTWRSRLFAGEKINATEGRAVGHTALRNLSGPPVLIDGKDVLPELRFLHERLEAFVASVREGRWRGAKGDPIKHIVNIGIGGSDLGARLASTALKDYTDGPQAHFIANIDASETKGVLAPLNPAETLFIVVSKTFTTQETLLNAQAARKWLVDALGEAAVARHFVAVSTNEAAVTQFGIESSNMFPMAEWVGGRFCLWSSAGLAVALAIGWDNFKALLAGAAVMDEHFRTAPLAQNIPVLLALAGVWYRNFWGTACHAVIPYSERLRDLPRYLQQLEMESNGKSVSRDGTTIDYATAPALFGECGSISQHSFHQWLHQGTDMATVDFIGIRENKAAPENHDVLLANLKAQATALMQGSVEPEAWRCNAGNKPSTLIWLDRLDPYHLGVLLALYEHKVFTQGVVWNINSFDQWGVELGKKLAKKVLADA